ncbi:PQQ-binding-like beta-propeller repeat protein [Asticcacaulis sp. SL142]|uniref:outer membrane protein assembly factor BamB family protein n=1 Tax=Asticcacaulis sp. SL142 TaxID=2995155 RepID=UPI00226CB91E|nr:PQQ-binding-like beta-propeller repeat protein [Asticcacaulis sp. SL142]WAC49461.1 PQQ-binding-like beta-propeller repeat protein [Asticcacaulis sp. SL142]
MRHLSGLACAIILPMSLAACGGGGGGGGGSSAPPVPPPPPSVTLSATSQSADVVEGQTETSLSFTATQSGSATTPIYPDVQYDAGFLTLDGSLTTSTSGQFSAKFKTKSDLGGGEYTGKVTFRLCQDVACATVYPNTTKEFDYKVIVNLKPWGVNQRDSKHSAYVDIHINPSKMTKVWSNSYSNLYGNIIPGGGLLYAQRITGVNINYGGVAALDVKTGNQIWSYEAGEGILSGGLVFSDNTVALTISPNFSNNIHVFLNSKNGEVIKRVSASDRVVGKTNAYSGNIFFMYGSENPKVSAYRASDGEFLWKQDNVGRSAVLSTAIDSSGINLYSDRSVKTYGTENGHLLSDIEDKSAESDGYSYEYSVVGTEGGRILVPAYTFDYLGNLKLRSFDTVKASEVWTSSFGYRIEPAYAKGVVYAFRTYPPQLDAIDEKTGAIKWSLTVSEGPWIEQKQVMGNAVVANNVIFVSSMYKLYAIDINTRQVIWSCDKPGRVIITPERYLIIAESGFDYISNDLRWTGILTAFKLD